MEMGGINARISMEMSANVGYIGTYRYLVNNTTHISNDVY